MYPAFLLHKRYWIFNNSGLFSWVCAACSDGMCMGWLLVFSFIKLNINTKLAFDSSAECFVAQVSHWWGSSSRWLKPKGGCCRQPQVSVLLLRVMWMGWCWAGLGCRGGKRQWLRRSLFASLHTLWMHTCARMLTPRVFGSFSSGLCAALPAHPSAHPQTGLLSAGRGSSTAVLFLPHLELINSLLVFLRKLGFGVLLSNTFGLIFYTVLGSCPQEYSLGWAFLGCKC